MTIKMRIILLVLAPVLLCSIISGSFSTVSSFNSTTKNMKDMSSYINAAYANAVTQDMNNLTNQVESVANDSGFFAEGASDKDKVALLQRHAAATDITNIGIFGADGKNIFAVNADGASVPKGVSDVSDRTYFTDAMAGETVVYGPTKDTVTGDAFITIATPVNVAGAPRSIVAVDFELALIDDLVDKATFGQTGHCFLLDNTGIFIADPDDSLIGMSYIDLAAQDPLYADLKVAIDGMLATQEPGEVSIVVGEESFTTYRRVDNTNGWILVTSAGDSEYFANFYAALTAQLIALIVFIIIAIMFALLIGKRMSDPIKAAARRAEALSRGDLTPDASPQGANRGDEIGVLVRSLDSAIGILTSYIHDISSKLGAMANNNFDLTVDMEYQGDFASIKSSLTAIVDSLNTMMLEIDQTSDQVAASSSQVANAAQALSQGATEQAGSTEEISASMAETMNEMNKTAENATLALAKTGESSTLLEDAKDSMVSMLKSMDEINVASESISKIIKSIDDIAFQTNILALNAAVEAARAGQHGKGFAVVADEVRNLASKSAAAAKETSDLIQGSKTAVEKGMRIANKTADGIRNTVQKSAEVGVLIHEVEGVIKEQTKSIGELSLAIDQISSVTQTNSATAEESAAASEELSSQAHMLKELVDQLNLRSKPVNNDGSVGSKAGCGSYHGDYGSAGFSIAAPNDHNKY